MLWELIFTSTVQNIILFSQGFNGPDGEIGPKGDKGQKVSFMYDTFLCKLSVGWLIIFRPGYSLKPY